MKPGGGCPLLTVSKLRTGVYPYVYRGFTLLLQSGGNYFVTPTPVDAGTHWNAANQSVFVIPDDGNIRVELTRGADYHRAPLTETAGPHPVFTC